MIRDPLTTRATYIAALRGAIRSAHGCEAVHIGSESVVDLHDGASQRIDVELFDLIGHPRANRCFAWAYPKASDIWNYVLILGIPPIRCASDAVRVHWRWREIGGVSGSHSK
jgi:hypothetical protein